MQWPKIQRAPGPEVVDTRTSTAGLRTVATFEALKGILVLLLGFTLLAIHSHAEDYTGRLLFHLHVDPDRRLAHTLMNAATRINDVRLWTIAGATLAYCSVRFTEAWGLWNRRVWAEWFALLSGAMYLPWEILKLIERTDWERVTVLCVNLAIILYMLLIRVRACWIIGNCEPPVATGPEIAAPSRSRL